MPSEDWVICRCEEVRLSEVLAAVGQGARDVDAVKRMTRAGMGLCQGRTCARLVSQIIARQLAVPVAQVRQARQRLPVRPTPASLFGGGKAES